VNKTTLLQHLKEVAGKIEERQTAVEQLPDIAEKQFASSLEAQSNPKDSADRQQAILFVDKRSIQSQVAKTFTEMGIQGSPIGAEQVQRMVAACGINLEDNTFSQAVIDMREE
jgi:hypothetical protein